MAAMRVPVKGNKKVGYESDELVGDRTTMEVKVAKVDLLRADMTVTEALKIVGITSGTYYRNKNGGAT